MAYSMFSSLIQLTDMKRYVANDVPLARAQNNHELNHLPCYITIFSRPPHSSKELRAHTVSLGYGMVWGVESPAKSKKKKRKILVSW